MYRQNGVQERLDDIRERPSEIFLCCKTPGKQAVYTRKVGEIMKKLKTLCLCIAVVMSLALVMPGVALAADPSVTILTMTDRLVNSVGGTFGSGTINYNIDASTGTHTATTTMNVNGATLGIDTRGVDTSVCHPGVVGEYNGFAGTGAFDATYKTSTNGNYGILGSYINASSKAGGATFQMADTQNFNIMSGNHSYNVVGNFLANASGNDAQVAMNLKSVGSMYCWSEATNPYSSPALQGNTISKESWVTKDGTMMTDLFMGVQTTGIATIANSNIWGFGNNESGTLASTNYGGGTRTVQSTGAGTYTQNGFGANQLNFNGFSFGGPSTSTLTGTFGAGFSGTYTMDGK